MSSSLISVILGHEGGWDEFLLIAAPVLFIGGLLALANRRVNQRLRDAADAPTGPQTTVPESGDPDQPES